MRSRLNLILSLVLTLISSVSAGSAESHSAPHLNVQIVSDRQEVSSGSSFHVGVLFKLEKGWHVYWKNPGDYGESPRIKWDVSSKVHVGDFQWPMPEKIQVGSVVSFGYQDEVLLPMPVQLELDYSEKNLRLQARVNWLVCREVCVPGKADLNLTLLVKSTALNTETPWSPSFEAALRMVPSPAPANWQATGMLTKDQFEVSLRGLSETPSEVSFFPSQGDQIDNSIPAKIRMANGEVSLSFKRSDRLTEDVDHFSGVLVITPVSGDSKAFDVDFRLGQNSFFRRIGLPLLFALLGGMLLNLMPCVFPVLSIKAMSVLKMSGGSRAEAIKQGWAYTLGILVSFWILVGTLLLLRLGGQQIGWGFQLQSPRFIFLLACVLFTFGLNLLGMFEISGSFTGSGSSLANRSGAVGSFFTGVLATLVATPCTVPFMGSAVGFALSQSAPVIFFIFTSLALGLALPYLFICYMPGLGDFLPKPGVWMETFKQLMAFLIFGTVVWLSWVLGLESSAFGLVLLLGAFVGISFAVWIAIKWRGLPALLIGLIVVILSAMAVPRSVSTTDVKNALNWEKFSPEALASYRAQGRPVFVDFTAAWCVSCQVNEMLVFHSNEIKMKLKELNVALLKGDWTNQDPVITQTLASFGRNGVPFYVLYGKKDAPADPLPEVISAGLVLTELGKIK